VQIAVGEVHPQRLAFGDVAGDQRAADARFERALQEALQRTGAVDRIVALAGDVLAGGFGELETDTCLLYTSDAADD